MSQSYTRNQPLDNDVTLSADSPYVAPTQHAVKTYVDNLIILGAWPFAHILTVSTTDTKADYATIANAISGAASGDVILLDGETFTEQIVVNKSLTFVSLKSGGTTITSTTSPTVQVTSGVVFFDNVTIVNGDNGAESFAVEVTDPSEVTFRNCSLLTDGAGTVTAGLHLDTGGGPTITLDNCNVGGGADLYGVLVTAGGDGIFVYGGFVQGNTDAINGDTSTLRLFGPRIDGTITWAGTPTGWYTDTTGVIGFRNSGGTGQYVKQSTANGTLSVGTIALDDATVSKLVASDANPNPALSADASGYLAAAVQPLFSAYLSANASNVTGDGTYYTVIFDTEVFDRNSNYNNSTGTFTAPVTGKYLFTCSILVQEIAAGHTLGNMQVVTSNRTYTSFYCNPAAVATSGFIQFQANVIADMDAADTAVFKVGITGSTKTVDIFGTSGPFTFVMGYLLP